MLLMNPELIQLIKTLETDLLQPETRRSPERLNALLADEFVELGTSGNRYTKEDILNILPASGAIRLRLFDFETREISPRTILVTYRVEKEIIESGERSWSVRSSLWRIRDGQWQILFHQGTPQT